MEFSGFANRDVAGDKIHGEGAKTWLWINGDQPF